MIIDGKNVFCPNQCPLPPEGCVVEASHVRVDASGDHARVVSTVIESSDPRFEIGVESVMTVDSEGKTADEIKQSIGECEGAKRSRVAKVLGAKGLCQGVSFIRNERV